jgi:hypothetical protein
MLDARRRNRLGSAGSGHLMTGIGPRLRLFGLLAVLVPLFLGLQHLVQESVPQIEVRFIAPDAQTAGSAPASSDRVVERVVYVPVEKTETAPMTAPSAVSSSAAVAQTTGRSADSPRQTSGLDSVGGPVMQAAQKEPPADAAIVELAHADTPAEEPPAHIGVVAEVTPVEAPIVAAAPSTRAVAAAPRIVTAPVVAAPPDPVDADEAIAEAEQEMPAEAIAEDEPEMVAEEEAATPVEQVAEIQVIETMVDGSQPSTRVVSYRIPVEPAPESAPAEAVEDESASPPAADEAVVEGDEAMQPGDAADDLADDAEAVDEDPASDEPAESAEDALSTVSAPTVWVANQGQ